MPLREVADRDPQRDLEGRFDTVAGAARAVEHLIDVQIPTAEIDVYGLDRSGNRGPKLRMKDVLGIKRGALVGAAVGAALGFVAFVIVSLSGMFGETDIGFLTLLHASYYIGACAAAGVPLGAALGMSGAAGKRQLDTTSARSESFVVVVRTDSLADEARQVLREAGASEVG